MCNNNCFGGNSWLIIIVLILLFSGGFNGCCGSGNDCGCRCGCN